MAKSNDPVFAQDPKTAGIDFGAASQSTVMDPSTVAPTALVTAGADGAIVTDIMIKAQGNVTLEKFILWIQPLGAGSWFAIDEALMAAYTTTITTIQGDVKFTQSADKTVETSAIRLNGTDVLGVTHQVDQQSMVSAEYTDF